MEEASVKNAPVRDVIVENLIGSAPAPAIEETPAEESTEELAEPSTQEAPTEESTVEDVVVEDLIGSAPTPIADKAANEITFNDIINLTAVDEGEGVLTEFTVDRQAGYNNTIDFYEVNADGSVTDSDTGATIAVGEEGYTEAAVAHRVGLNLATESGTTSEFLAELAGGKYYAPVIAVDSDFEAFSDDSSDSHPTVYFGYSEANVDNSGHVRNSEPNVFEFEDLPNNGDADFNDVVVTVSSDNPSLSFADSVDEVAADEVVVENLIGSAPSPTEETAAAEPITDVPVEESVAEVSADEVVVENLIGSAPSPTEEAAAAEPITDVPVEESVADKSSEESTTPNDFEEVEAQTQTSSDSGTSSTSKSFSSISDGGVELSAEVIQSSDGGSKNVFSENFDIDITGGTVGESSIMLEVAADGEGSLTSGAFAGAVLSDIAGELPAIENVSLDEAATTLGLDSSDVTFTEDTISVNLESLSVKPGLSAMFDVDFADI